MKNSIPNIKFNPAAKEHLEFEIVPIEKIARSKASHEHNPELPHQLKFYNFIFFTEGSGKHFVDFNWYPVQKNSLVYLTKEQINAFQFSDHLKGFCIIFTEDFFISSFSHLPKDFIVRLFNPQLFSPILQIPAASDFINYFDLLRKEYDATEPTYQKTILNSLFVILLSKAELIKQNQTFHINDSGKINLFQRFTNLIKNNFTQTRSAAFYAKELAVTYKYLNTICKKLINKTAKNVIDDFIILQAKRNLINSDIKSTALAYKLGFEDPTNFTKYFKKSTGLTPKAFKNLYNK